MTQKIIFWFKVFVHWQLKLINFLIDSDSVSFNFFFVLCLYSEGFDQDFEQEMNMLELYMIIYAVQ